jgi:hypothetical protein
MKITRRNALIGLGSVVVGSGALVGSGAFSSVSAQRSVGVNSAGDSNALLGLEVTGDLTGSGETINFDLSEDLNLDAITRFNSALTITNNGNDMVTVDIEAGEVTTDSADSLIGTSPTPLRFEQASGDAVDSLSSSVTFDIVFDLTGTTTTSTADSNIPDNITILANEN